MTWHVPKFVTSFIILKHDESLVFKNVQCINEITSFQKAT